ncbi:MAG: hypothetical protein EOP04_26180, partial [Proteobacteria bacterium]
MKKYMGLISAILTISIHFASIFSEAQASEHSMPHEMQHGFVLAEDSKFASHLVATGHHSRQVE